MPNEIPVDPKLPKDFDSTPNENRSKDELDRWWDHPYCVTVDKGFDVRCLNGGAWDRSSWLGRASTYRDACELAEKKQAEWVKKRELLFTHVHDFTLGTCDLVRKSRPDREDEVLASFTSLEECAQHIKSLKALEPTVD